MATNSYVQVPPDSTGKKLHTKQHTVGVNTVEIQGYHLSDPINPAYTQHVDAQGQANVRFAEGSPSMEAFGGLRTSTGKMIGVYDFTTDSADDLFSDTFLTGGALTYMSDASTISLAVNSTSGSFAGRVSDKYHFYWPGCGNLVTMTVALSDSNHIGCERRWGYFDANDGIYFELDDAGVFNVTMRSSVSGSIVKTHIPRSSWNGDKLDGTGLSEMTLDLTKLNIYWMDLQWLGGGRVRMGVVDSKGNRVICHTFENANNNLYPYMRTGTLPIAFNIENVSNTGGAASIRMTCCAVKTEGEVNYTYWRYSYDAPSKLIVGSNKPIITLKSLNTWGGKHNVTTAFPESFCCYVSGGTIKLQVYWDDMDHTGSTYALDNGSTVIADTAATATTITTQAVMRTFYLDTGSHCVDLSSFFETNDVALNAKSTNTTPLQIALVASVVSGTPTVEGALNYRELR